MAEIPPPTMEQLSKRVDALEVLVKTQAQQLEQFQKDFTALVERANKMVDEMMPKLAEKFGVKIPAAGGPAKKGRFGW